MSGYRDTSNYLPLGGTNYGRPLRPFDKWQWIGAAIDGAGVLVLLGMLGARLAGIAVDTADWLPIGMGLCTIGVLLINSRRETLTAEQSATRRRRALIVLGVVLLFLAILFATIFMFKGA